MDLEDLPYWASGPEVDAMNTAVDHYYPGLRTSNNWNEGAAEEPGHQASSCRDAVKAGGLTASATPQVPQRSCRAWIRSTATRLTVGLLR